MEKEEMAISIVEAFYIDLMKGKREFSELECNRLHSLIFPPDWNKSIDYQKKTNFLNKAIESEVNLLSLKGIEVFIEGIAE